MDPGPAVEGALKVTLAASADPCNIPFANTVFKSENKTIDRELQLLDIALLNTPRGMLGWC